MTDNPYMAAANVLLAESGCTVRKWRTTTTGTAYTRSDDWGIESPEPRGPISFAVFAHEVAHQLKHRYNSAPRWLEELEAWEYALEQMDRFELAGYDKVQHKAARCLAYAAHKANRRASDATARRILDRFPTWVWALDGSRGAMIAVDLERI